MKIPIVKIDCPNCSLGINIPFFASLEAKALEDYDLNETSAQSELADLRMWLWRASPFDLLKYWLKRKNNEPKVKQGLLDEFYVVQLTEE